MKRDWVIKIYTALAQKYASYKNRITMKSGQTHEVMRYKTVDLYLKLAYFWAVQFLLPSLYQ